MTNHRVVDKGISDGTLIEKLGFDDLLCTSINESWWIPFPCIDDGSDVRRYEERRRDETEKFLFYILSLRHFVTIFGIEPLYQYIVKTFRYHEVFLNQEPTVYVSAQRVS